MEADMIARGLVRAKIRTLKGNEVWRWVKPDNGNIIERATAAEPKVIVEEKIVVPPEPLAAPPPAAQFKTHSYPSCCGASFVQRIANPKTRTEEEWAELYAKSQAKYYHDTYLERSKTARAVSDRRYYEETAKAYTLEAWKTSEALRINGYGTTNPTSPGIAVSMTEFPGATQTPGGIWVRQDRAPVSKAEKDHFEPAVVVDFEALIPLCLRDMDKGVANIRTVCARNPYKVAITSYGFESRFHLFVGLGIYSGYGVHPAALVLRLWHNIVASKVKAGDHVQFIMNQSQRNSNGYTIPQAYAAAGFREVLRTGNSNHPGESTLYLYERVITEQDVADATSIIYTGFFNGQ
jgi:hypothetical protein